MKLPLTRLPLKKQILRWEGGVILIELVRRGSTPTEAPTTAYIVSSKANTRQEYFESLPTATEFFERETARYNTPVAEYRAARVAGAGRGA